MNTIITDSVVQRLVSIGVKNTNLYIDVDEHT